MQNTLKTVISAFAAIILVNSYLVECFFTYPTPGPIYQFCNDGSWISFLWARRPVYEKVENITFGFRTTQPSGLLLKIGDPDTPELATIVHVASGNVYATQKLRDRTIVEVFDKSVKVNDNLYHDIKIHHGNSFSIQVDGNTEISDTNFKNGGREQRFGGNIDLGGSSKHYGIDFFNGTISKVMINDFDIDEYVDSLFVAVAYNPTQPYNSSWNGTTTFVKNIDYDTRNFHLDKTNPESDDIIIPICRSIEKQLPDPQSKTNVTIKRAAYECDDEDCIDGSGSGSGSGEIPVDIDYPATAVPTTSIIYMVPTESTTFVAPETTDFYWISSSTSEATSQETTTAIKREPSSTSSPSTVSSTTEEYIYTKRISPDESSRSSTVRSSTSYDTQPTYEQTETEDYLSTQYPGVTEYPEVHDDSSINFLSIQIISIIALCVGLVLTTIVLIYVFIAKRRSRKSKKATV